MNKTELESYLKGVLLQLHDAHSKLDILPCGLERFLEKEWDINRCFNIAKILRIELDISVVPNQPPT